MCSIYYFNKKTPVALAKEIEEAHQQAITIVQENLQLKHLRKEINLLKQKEKTKEAAKPEKAKNILFNLKVQLEIPNAPIIKVNAILDTGATTCCIDEGAIPREALEKNPYLVHFNEITSKTTTDKKLRGGRMMIGDNSFRIPYTYAFPMKLGDDIQMIIGCNFIRAMQGGVRIEGNTITFYKNLTTINTLPYLVLYSTEPQKDEDKLRAQFGSLIEKLKAQGYIGENPLQHWKKNGLMCELEIKTQTLQ
ncbi:unnamed protein product [Musa acuminata subsp. malaccensis]|uniref:(wild Malaysian banana) hypothetical protein n=1 Tax=Musa acuminata subsp. malaccensis TaxID=214687 RepID=A0A804HXI7_MUSAM|nr:unnamed protein product [Musa acuminata subsp. malaccensis]